MKKKTRTRLLPMDELKARPCEVDGRQALFHRWVENDRVLLRIGRLCTPEDEARLAYKFREDDLVSPGCNTEVIRETFALVEYKDGTVELVDPLRIRFTDQEGNDGRKD